MHPPAHPPAPSASRCTGPRMRVDPHHAVDPADVIDHHRRKLRKQNPATTAVDSHAPGHHNSDPSDGRCDDPVLPPHQRAGTLVAEPGSLFAAIGSSTGFTKPEPEPLTVQVRNHGCRWCTSPLRPGGAQKLSHRHQDRRGSVAATMRCRTGTLRLPPCGFDAWTAAGQGSHHVRIFRRSACTCSRDRLARDAPSGRTVDLELKI